MKLNTINDTLPSYRITSNRTSDILGNIFYYHRWKKYVLDPKENTVGDEKCLEIIINFLKELNGNKEKAILV